MSLADEHDSTKGKAKRICLRGTSRTAGSFDRRTGSDKATYPRSMTRPIKVDRSESRWNSHRLTAGISQSCRDAEPK